MDSPRCIYERTDDGCWCVSWAMSAHVRLVYAVSILTATTNKTFY